MPTREDIVPTGLIAAAIKSRGDAYCPYSKYSVGAALAVEGGAVIVGCNVENLSYGLTVCAERVAIGNFVAQGYGPKNGGEGKKIVAIAVATRDGATPCGACRQVLREFASGDCPVFCVAQDGSWRRFRLGDLLPDHFESASVRNQRG